MLRRIVTALSLAAVGLLALPTLAFAVPPYAAPPVTPATDVVSASARSSVVVDPSTTLASTGAGFSVGTAVVIAAVVVLVGLALLVVGNKLRKAGNH